MDGASYKICERLDRDKVSLLPHLTGTLLLMMFKAIYLLQKIQRLSKKSFALQLNSKLERRERQSHPFEC